METGAGELSARHVPDKMILLLLLILTLRKPSQLRVRRAAGRFISAPLAAALFRVHLFWQLVEKQHRNPQPNRDAFRLVLKSNQDFYHVPVALVSGI